jgi:formylglycine-generating enzyme required for sulfatase activity
MNIQLHISSRLLLQCLIWLALVAARTAFSQQINVQSFQLLESDMDARIVYPKNDQDGKLCAIVKVVTVETGFSFDVGMVGIVDIAYKPGEIWLYLRNGTQRITITHEKLGVLRNYFFPIPIESGMTYEMKLITARVEQVIVEPEIESQWLLIDATPNTALIFLNDQFEGSGNLQKKLMPGRYTYRIEAPLYYPEAGIINITTDNRESLEVSLNPNFGFIEVITEPESGARVLINGREAGFVSNGRSEALQSGEYTVTAIKEQFQPASGKVSLSDNETQTVVLKLTPNFATVEVGIPNDAVLFVNNQRRSHGSWNGRLNAGIYLLEARKPNHYTARQEIQLKAGDQRTFSLEPQPITGSLDVISTPPQANVRLNGQLVGTTPITVESLLVGEYVLIIDKPGFNAVQKMVSVSEGGTTLVKEELPEAGLFVEIVSEPEGAEVFIAGKKSGETPYRGFLPFGTHQLRVAKGSRSFEERISIVSGGKTRYFYNVAEPEPVASAPLIAEPTASEPVVPELAQTPVPEQHSTKKIIEVEMVFVRGGSFSMGCTAEQGGDCFENETPVSTVTLKSFYISKYEITVAQFREFIDETAYRTDADKKGGSDFFDGSEWKFRSGVNWAVNENGVPRPPGEDQHPVSFVSWNDAVAFCAWLSDKTGNKYRLPTEAEWEYAARGGRSSKNNKFAGSNQPEDVAVFWNNAGDKPLDGNWEWQRIASNNNRSHRVGSKNANELGIHDMSGNVWEWCSDWFGDYTSQSKSNPGGPAHGTARVVRGGAFTSGERNCRVSFRNSSEPNTTRSTLGFRIVMEAD